MLNIRNYAFNKQIVYYLLIAPSLTLAVNNDPRQESLSQHLVLIVPRSADRPDRTGKWKQDSVVTKLDQKTKAATVYEPDITLAIKAAIEEYYLQSKNTKKDKETKQNPEGELEAPKEPQQGLWIVASSYEASQILNDFEGVSKALTGVENYKLILLNPNEHLLELNKLDAISDPNLVVVELDKEYPEVYSEFLNKFRSKYNQEIVSWVAEKEMFEWEKDWRFLSEWELHKVGRVATEMLGPRSLPKKKESAPSDSLLSVEKIFAEIDKIKTDGPSKIVEERHKLMVGEHPEASRKHYFKGWKDEEIIAYIDHISKWSVNIANPYITFVSWADNLREVINSKTPPPESFSNRERWKEKGFRVLDQHGTKGGSCQSFAFAHGLQAAMIEAGEDGRSINETAWHHMGSNDFGKSNYGSRRKWRFQDGYPLARTRLMDDYGFEDAMLKGIPLKGGKVFKPIQMILSDLQNFFYRPNAFPWWIKKNIEDIDRTTHAKLILEGRYYDKNFELKTGYRDAMMKKEISKGRPIVVATVIPEGWQKDGYAYKERGKVVQRLWWDPPRGGKFGNPSGEQHAYIIVGYKPDPLDYRKTIYECLNSWGPGWGDEGHFYVSSEWFDWYTLLWRTWMVSIALE